MFLVSQDFYWTLNKIANWVDIKSFDRHQEILEQFLKFPVILIHPAPAVRYSILMDVWGKKRLHSVSKHQPMLQCTPIRKKSWEVRFLETKHLVSLLGLCFFCGLITLMFQFWREHFVELHFTRVLRNQFVFNFCSHVAAILINSSNFFWSYSFLPPFNFNSD